MQLLDGLATAAAIRQELAAQVAHRSSQGFHPPHLAAVLIGNHPPSESYVSAKMKACEEVGFRSSLIRRPESTTEDEMLKLVDELNEDSQLDGFIVQLPLPKHISETKVLLRIDPAKDVDGFHPMNFGRMTLGLEAFIPATPLGVLTLLERYDIETSGKHCVVLGRSHIVGLPASILMQRNAYPGNATVTIVHSKSKGVKEICASADILIVAIGRPEFVTEEFVQPGAVVIDVGISRIEDASKKSGFRLAGDVHFASVAPKCSFITPVPGGVGPMTIASLLSNTYKAASNNPFRQM